MVCPKLFLFFFGLIYRVPLIKTPSIVDKSPNTQSTRKYVSDVFIQEETGYRSKKQLLLEPSNYFDKSALIYSFLSDPYAKLSIDQGNSGSLLSLQASQDGLLSNPFGTFIDTLAAWCSCCGSSLAENTRSISVYTN